MWACARAGARRRASLAYSSTPPAALSEAAAHERGIGWEDARWLVKLAERKQKAEDMLAEESERISRRTRKQQPRRKQRSESSESESESISEAAG